MKYKEQKKLKKIIENQKPLGNVPVLFLRKKNFIKSKCSKNLNLLKSFAFCFFVKKKKEQKKLKKIFENPKPLEIGTILIFRKTKDF